MGSAGSLPWLARHSSDAPTTDNEPMIIGGLQHGDKITLGRRLTRLGTFAIRSKAKILQIDCSWNLS